MSELERLEDETSNATTAGEPAPEVNAPPADAATSDATGAPAASDETKADGARPAGNGSAPALNPDGTPKKKRRRGSRGGRNRKKPGQGANAAEGGGQGQRTQGGQQQRKPIPERRSEPGDDAPRVGGGEDWNDAAADRGLTDDDIALSAMEDAGLPTRGERPKIGDSRPSPKTPAVAKADGGEASDGESTGPKKRRRRRGGRGRSRSSSGPSSSNAPQAPTAGGNRPKNRPTTGFVDAGEMGTVDVDGTSLLDSLDEETLERRRGTRRKGRPAGRYLMVVHQRADGYAHIAVLEGRQLVEHYVSTPTDETTSIDGNIYLGRVQNVLPGMEAAFIDIGTPKNGVLYRGDVAYDPRDVEGREKPRIESVLRNGQAITVQVTKNPIAHKGARLTQEVSLAGRFVVMVPNQPTTYGISKRLPDDERKRLRRVLDRLRPADAGLIVRTAAEGATEEELERDMLRLNAQWSQISEYSKKAKPGSLLYKEPPLAIRLIREEFTKEYRGVIIDDRQLYDEVMAYIDAIAPELSERVEYYDPVEEHLPVFEKFHVHEQLHKALDRKVWLPSGGSLIIERTEALTVIDVNTGKNVGSSNLEETVYRNNLEAAEVVARELRLRDIGGIIVIDFIDMESKRNREAVESAFQEALARDKTRTQIFPISELGLVEMTRKRVSEGLVEAFSSTCPHCNGRGFVVDESMLE
jgi:ribonuclease E